MLLLLWLACFRIVCKAFRTWPDVRLQQPADLEVVEESIGDGVESLNESLLALKNDAAEFPSELSVHPLTPHYEECLARGQIYTAIVLAGWYIEAPGQARLGQRGSTAKIISPFQEERGWVSEPKFVQRFGRRASCGYIWMGSGDDKTIYITFNPARGRKQIVTKIWWNSALEISCPDGIRMHAYVRKKLDAMWENGEYGGLRMKLRQLAISTEYKDYTFTFAGLSLGGCMAQAVGLRFARNVVPWREQNGMVGSVAFNVISWNGFLWTNQDGANVVQRELGDRLLLLVNTQIGTRSGQRYWDPPSGFDFSNRGFATVRPVRLLEVGCWREPKKQVQFSDEKACGEILRCSPANKCPGHSSIMSRAFYDRFEKLHFASRITAGIKAATIKADERQTMRRQLFQKTR